MQGPRTVTKGWDYFKCDTQDCLQKLFLTGLKLPLGEGGGQNNFKTEKYDILGDFVYRSHTFTSVLDGVKTIKQHHTITSHFLVLMRLNHSFSLSLIFSYTPWAQCCSDTSGSRLYMWELLVESVYDGSYGMHAIRLFLHLCVEGAFRLAEECVSVVLQSLVVFWLLLFCDNVIQILKRKKVRISPMNCKMLISRVIICSYFATWESTFNQSNEQHFAENISIMWTKRHSHKAVFCILNILKAIENKQTKKKNPKQNKTRFCFT